MEDDSREETENNMTNSCSKDNCAELMELVEKMYREYHTARSNIKKLREKLTDNNFTNKPTIAIQNKSQQLSVLSASIISFNLKTKDDTQISAPTCVMKNTKPINISFNIFNGEIIDDKIDLNLEISVKYNPKRFKKYTDIPLTKSDDGYNFTIHPDIVDTIKNSNFDIIGKLNGNLYVKLGSGKNEYIDIKNINQKIMSRAKLEPFYIIHKQPLNQMFIVGYMHNPRFTIDKETSERIPASYMAFNGADKNNILHNFNINLHCMPENENIYWQLMALKK
jgi:hypothetical protein